MSLELRQRLIGTAIAMNDSGINQGTSGNLSLRFEDGMLITPAGMDYAGLDPGDIVHVDARGAPIGSRQPSSEWRFHLDIYRYRPDAATVLHAHPTYCAALACMNRPIPAFHYMVAVAGGKDIRCAPYATFGSQALSDRVLEALIDRKACLLANHGMVCLESDPDKVLALAIEVEHLSRVYLQCLQTGGPTIISDEEMAVVIEKFKHYGMQAKADIESG
jgi:L-fuculose-phosphate aldolase